MCVVVYIQAKVLLLEQTSARKGEAMLVQDQKVLMDWKSLLAALCVYSPRTPTIKCANYAESRRSN